MDAAAPPPIATLAERAAVAATIGRLYEAHGDAPPPALNARLHSAYLRRHLEAPLPPAFVALDASTPWLVYWVVHGLDLLGDAVGDADAARLLAALAACQHPAGGFGGGPGQDAHLACTYAALAAIAVLGRPTGYALVDRPRLAAFLTRMHLPSGAFTVCSGGEHDVRGAYCAVAVAALAGLPADTFDGAATAAFLTSCQTYEGGFAGLPGGEAHCGYTYCAAAALAILADAHPGAALSLDAAALEAFAGRRFDRACRAFGGRANKVVDGCYSFWAGALFPLVDRLGRHSQEDRRASRACNDRKEERARIGTGLAAYILTCCQSDTTGGLWDKPGKAADYYHTCYCLSGLAIAAHDASLSGAAAASIEATDVLFNVRPARLAAMRAHLAAAP